jgi:hypothetical protein
MKNIIIFLVLLISPIVLVNLLPPDDSGLFFAISPWLILVAWIVWGIVRFFKRIFAERAEYVKNNKSVAQIDKEIRETKENIKNMTRDMIQDANNSEHRDLALDSLIMMVTANLGETIDIIKESSDPLVRMVVAHMFIEQLSENYDKNASSVGVFSYELFKSELHENDWDVNFADADLNSEYFQTPVYWAEVLQNRISESYKKTSDSGLKSSVCADFCTDLFSKIEDDSLKQKFINLSRNKIKDFNLYTKSAESTYTSIEF